MKLFRDIFLFSIILFLSLGLYCASKNGWLPLVHGPYYFSIGQSLFNYNEINQYAIYPPVQSLVYTLQIGISFFEYLIFFITEKFWYIPFYGIISIIWVIAFNEFLKLNLKYIDRIDKYLIFSIFFLQPYNLNQLGNFSNESLYFPLLLYFYFSFFRNSLSKINVNFYWIALSIFIIFGVYFRLHHVVICINFFIFSLFLKKKDLSFFIILLGILNIVVFYLVIKNTYLNEVFLEHLSYLNNNISSSSSFDGLNSYIKVLEKFFVIITYPLLLTKFTKETTVYLFIGFLILYLIFLNFKNINKENKLFNIYNIFYFSLSSLFVLLLPPFEYSYVLPFAFIIFIYAFIGFKFLIPKLYKVIFKLVLIFGIIFIGLNYFIIGSSLIEGYEYRRFIKDLKKMYVQDMQEIGVFYIARDAQDNFEEFYWQNKKKVPFCQIRKVTVEKCVEVQKKDNDFFIYILGKNFDNLGEEFKIPLKENHNLKDDLDPLLDKILYEFNKNQQPNDYYTTSKVERSDYFFYILLKKNLK